MGTRLESEGDILLQTQACLCYICAGNVEKLVACWIKAQDGSSPLSLQVSIFETRGAYFLVLFHPTSILEIDLFQKFIAFTLVTYVLEVLLLDNLCVFVAYLAGQSMR